MWNYRTVYELEDLSPKSMHSFSERIYYEEAAATLYKNNRYIRGSGVDVNEECNYECRIVMYCQTVSNDYDEWQFCRDRSKFDLLEIN